MIGATRRRLLGGAGAALAASVAAGGCRAGQAGARPADPAEARAMDVLKEMERRRGIGVSREDGELLRRSVEGVKARRAVEIGTYRGYSGVWTALGLRATGGHLTTYDIDRSLAEEARRNFQAAGVEDLITIVIGDAHKELPKQADGIDFAFIDADKEGYLDYLRTLLPKMTVGGLILAHNVHYPTPDPKFMAAIRDDPRLETRFANMDGAGMSISRKLR
jgi:predicted O-methyltransferase YrrM